MEDQLIKDEQSLHDLYHAGLIDKEESVKITIN